MKTAGFAVEAWHVDHGWRLSSSEEAKALQRQAAAWRIPFVSARVSSDAAPKREAEARKARFACFQRWSVERRINTLCIAHHREDQAETICMRMLQGAGPVGCCGMHTARRMEGMMVLRPLLHISGDALRQTLTEAGISWFEDPSNRETAIWRNRIRHTLFPKMAASGVDPVALFLRWGQAAQSVSQSLDAAAQQTLDGQWRQGDGWVSLPWMNWKQSTPSVRARMLQFWMAALFGEGATPGRRHILLVEVWTQSGCRGGVDLSRCRLYREADRLYLRLQLHAGTAVCGAGAEMERVSSSVHTGVTD